MGRERGVYIQDRWVKLGFERVEFFLNSNHRFEVLFSIISIIQYETRKVIVSMSYTWLLILIDFLFYVENFFSLIYCHISSSHILLLKRKITRKHKII